MEPSPELDHALALVRRWHDQRPGRRRMLDRDEIRSVRVLGPVQVRLRTLHEDRFYDFEEGPAPEDDSPVEAEPEDPWGVTLDDVELSAMVQDAEEQRTRWPELPAIVRPCSHCEGEGTVRCHACGGDGIVDIAGCGECGGGGKVPCRDCRGTARRTVRVRIRRRFRFDEATRIHEDESDEVGPHVLLHLVDHPTPGEVFHEQDAPRIQRYAGKGSGTSYREAATPMAATIEKLLKDAQPEQGEHIAHQWLSVTRIPVYALGLSRGRTAYVYGDPPKVSPPGLLRPSWLVLVPLLAAMALLAGAAFTFFWLVARAKGQ